MNQQQQIEDVVRLWVDTFGDPETFASDYLQRVPEAFRSLSYQNGELVSMVLGVPFLMNLWGEEVLVSYDGSFAARPSVRGTGIAKETYERLIRQHFESGVLIDLGIMADEGLRDYYQRTFQFATPGIWTTSHWLQEKEQTSQPDMSRMMKNLSLRLIEDPSPYIAQFCCDIPNVLLPDDQTIRLSSNDTRYYQLIDSQADCVGIIGVDATQLPVLYLFEVADEDFREPALCLLSDLYGTQEWVYRRYDPSTDERGLAYGRVIRVEDALTMWARQHASVSRLITVDDSIIPQNCHTYRIARGEVWVEDHRVAESDRLSMAELTEWIVPQIYLPVSYY